MNEGASNIFQEVEEGRLQARKKTRLFRIILIAYHLLSILLFGLVIYALRTFGTVYPWLEPLMYFLILLWVYILVGFVLYKRWSWYGMFICSMAITLIPIACLFDFIRQDVNDVVSTAVLISTSFVLIIPIFLLQHKKLKANYF